MKTLENAMTVECPCYTMNGMCWLETHTPTGVDVWYLLMFRDYLVARSTPAHAVDAVQNYRDTLRALLLAGF